jgi:hypothetical protein
MLQKIENVILDIDHTLVHTITYEEFETLPIEVLQDLQFEYFEKDEFKAVIILRPFLNEFLDYLFTNFNVALWTAGEEEYAHMIIEKVIKREPVICLSSMDVKICNMNYPGYKNLNYLYNIIPAFNKTNTVIVDDQIHVLKTNKINCINIPAFQVIYNAIMSSYKENENDQPMVNYNCIYDISLIQLCNYFLTHSLNNVVK